MSAANDPVKSFLNLATPLQSAWAARPPVNSHNYFSWGLLFTTDVNNFTAAFHSIPQSGPPVPVPNFLLAVLNELLTYRKAGRRIDPGNMQPNGDYPPRGRLIKDDSHSFAYQANGWWDKFALHSIPPAVPNVGNSEETRNENEGEAASEATIQLGDTAPAGTPGPNTRSSKRRRKSTSEPESGVQMDEHIPSEANEAAGTLSTPATKRRRKVAPKGESGNHAVETPPADVEEGTNTRPSRAAKRRKATSEGESEGESVENAQTDVRQGTSEHPTRQGKRRKTGKPVAKDRMDGDILPATVIATDLEGTTRRLRSHRNTDDSSRAGASSVSGPGSSDRIPAEDAPSHSPATVCTAPADVVSHACKTLLADTWDFKTNDVPNRWVPSSRECSNCVARNSTCRVNIAHGTSCNFCTKYHRNCDLSPAANQYPSSTDRAWLLLDWLRKPTAPVPSRGGKKRVKIPNWFRPALKKASTTYTKVRKGEEDRIIAAKPTYFGDNLTGGRKRSFIPQSDQEEDPGDVGQARDQMSSGAEGRASGTSRRLDADEATAAPTTRRATWAAPSETGRSQPSPPADGNRPKQSTASNGKGKEREQNTADDGFEEAAWWASFVAGSDVATGLDRQATTNVNQAAISTMEVSAGSRGSAMGGSSGRKAQTSSAAHVAADSSTRAVSKGPLPVRLAAPNDKSLPSVESILAARRDGLSGGNAASRQPHSTSPELRANPNEPDHPTLSPPSPFGKDNPAIKFQLSLLPNRKIDMELSPQFEWETGDLIGPEMPFADPADWDRADPHNAAPSASSHIGPMLNVRTVREALVPSAPKPHLSPSKGPPSESRNARTHREGIASENRPHIPSRSPTAVPGSSSSRALPPVTSPHPFSSATLASNSPVHLPAVRTRLLGSPPTAIPASKGTGLRADSQGFPQGHKRTAASDARVDSGAKTSHTWLASTHVRAAGIVPDLWGVERGGSYLSMVDSINHDFVALSMEARILWDATLLLGGEGARACWRIKDLEETWERWSQGLETSIDNTSHVLSDLRKLLARKDRELAAQSARIDAIEAYLRSKDPSAFPQGSADDSADDGDDEENEDRSVSGTSPRESAVGEERVPGSEDEENFEDEIDELYREDMTQVNSNMGESGESNDNRDAAEELPAWTSLCSSPGTTEAVDFSFSSATGRQDGVHIVHTPERHASPLSAPTMPLIAAHSAALPLPAGDDALEPQSRGTIVHRASGGVQEGDSAAVTGVLQSQNVPSFPSPSVLDAAPSSGGRPQTPLSTGPICGQTAASPPGFSVSRRSLSSPIPAPTDPHTSDLPLPDSTKTGGDRKASSVDEEPASNGETTCPPFCGPVNSSPPPSSQTAVDEASSEPPLHPASSQTSSASVVPHKLTHTATVWSNARTPAASAAGGTMTHIDKSLGDIVDPDLAIEGTAGEGSQITLDPVAHRE